MNVLLCQQITLWCLSHFLNYFMKCLFTDVSDLKFTSAPPRGAPVTNSCRMTSQTNGKNANNAWNLTFKWLWFNLRRTCLDWDLNMQPSVHASVCLWHLKLSVIMCFAAALWTNKHILLGSHDLYNYFYSMLLISFCLLHMYYYACGDYECKLCASKLCHYY